MNLGFDCTLFPAVSGGNNFSPFVCQICNRFYHRPLLLPCSHSFCEKCVYDAAFRNYNIFVCRRCKTVCNVTTEQMKYNKDLTNAVRLVGPINTSHLWVDFKIRCLGHGDTLKEASTDPELLKKWLCLPCSRLVCLKCTGSGGAHADHEIVPAISHVDFDALYMEALKASFAYNVVQQTSNELFWLLEDLKVAIARLQDYCESYYTYIDEHVSLTQGCLATVAVALKRQVWRQAANKRRRLQKCARLAAELMEEARRRETHGNILLEPLDPVHSAKAYNEAQKWLLFWIASPPARIQLVKANSVPDPIGTNRPCSTSDPDSEKSVKCSPVIVPPDKSKCEVTVDSHVLQHEKRVSPIGSNRPTFKTSFEGDEGVVQRPVVSDTRDVLTGLQLPLHQALTTKNESSVTTTKSIKLAAPILDLPTEEGDQKGNLNAIDLTFNSKWPASKVEFDKIGNLITRLDSTSGDRNREVLVDVKEPLQSTPIGANRPTFKLRTGTEDSDELTCQAKRTAVQSGRSNNDGKREVLAGIQLPIHQNYSCLSKSCSETSTSAIHPIKGPQTHSHVVSNVENNHSASISFVTTENAEAKVSTESASQLMTQDEFYRGSIWEAGKSYSSMDCQLPFVHLSHSCHSSVLLSKASCQSRNGTAEMQNSNTLLAATIPLENKQTILQNDSSVVHRKFRMHFDVESELQCGHDPNTSVSEINVALRKEEEVENPDVNASVFGTDIGLCKEMVKYVFDSNTSITDKNVNICSGTVASGHDLVNSLNEIIVTEHCREIGTGHHEFRSLGVSLHDDKGTEFSRSVRNMTDVSSNNDLGINGKTTVSDKQHEAELQETAVKSLVNDSDNTFEDKELLQQACKQSDREFHKKENAINNIDGNDVFSGSEEGAVGYVHNLPVSEEFANNKRNIIHYSRDELIKLAKVASERYKMDENKTQEWDKNVVKQKKKQAKEDFRRVPDNTTEENGHEPKEPLQTNKLHLSSFSAEGTEVKDSYSEDLDNEEIDAERILEGLECSFVRMAWDTVESILSELRFVHSDVNWAELWHLLASAARPDAEFRLHPSDGAHCVTTRAVHLLHTAPLLNPRMLWANWGRRHPCQIHQSRWNKCKPRGSSDSASLGLSSLFSSHEQTGCKTQSSKDASNDATTSEINVGKIPIPKVKTGTSNLLGETYSPTGNNKDCCELDYSAVVKGGVHRKASPDARPVRSWAELVSGGPRTHCCKQPFNNSNLPQNPPQFQSLSLSQAVKTTEELQGPCGSAYMSNSIVDELLHKLTTPEKENIDMKTYNNAQFKYNTNGCPLSSEQYRMHCLLNSLTVDLGSCTNPNYPKCNPVAADGCHHYTATSDASDKQTNASFCAFSEQQTDHGRGLNHISWVKEKSQPPDITVDHVSLEGVRNENEVLRSKCTDFNLNFEKTQFPSTDNVNKNRNIDRENSCGSLTRTELAGLTDNFWEQKVPVTRNHGVRDGVHTNRYDKQYGNSSVVQMLGSRMQEDKFEVKSKNTLTLADWITPRHSRIHKPIATGGSASWYYSREFVPSPENEPKHTGIADNVPKGTTRLPTVRKGRPQKTNGLGKDNKPRSRGSSADQGERVSQTKMHVSKAKIRKEQRILRQSQKKPWSTAGRKSCEQKDDPDCCSKEESGEKDDPCTEDSPEDKSPDDSEDADLSIDSLPTEQSRQGKGEEQERSGQDTDDEWLNGKLWQPSQGQGEGDTTQGSTVDVMKRGSSSDFIERAVVGGDNGGMELPSSPTSDITPEMIEFFRSRRKGRLGSNKSTRTDHRRVHRERQVKKASSGIGEKV